MILPGTGAVRSIAKSMKTAYSADTEPKGQLSPSNYCACNKSTPVTPFTDAVDEPKHQPNQDLLVDSYRLLEAVWEEKSRPSIRWLKYQQHLRTIPVIRIGGRTFFSPAAVRAALAERHTIRSRT